MLRRRGGSGTSPRTRPATPGGRGRALQAAFAERILALFPGCLGERATAIARHAVTRGSGRVGRSAAGRAVADEAVTLAVIASARHEDTRYDQLLMSGVSREEARALVRNAVDAVLDRWRAG